MSKATGASPVKNSEITEILETQTYNYKQLLILSHNKKDAIVNNDIKALERIVFLESVIVNKNIKLEEARIELCNNVAQALDEPEGITLSRLLDVFKGQNGFENLEVVAGEIRLVMEELKESNDFNKLLIEQTMDYFAFSMSLIGRIGVLKPSLIDIST